MSITEKHGFRRVAALFMAHVFIAGLSVSCGQYDDVSHGPYLLKVPRQGGGFQASKSVDFFLDEEVDEGVLTGWIHGTGCPARVLLCDAGECEIVFSTFAGPNEVMFEVYSENSYVFDSFLESFAPCYKDDEFAQEPFSCQRWVCDQSKEDIDIIFEADGCSASLQAVIEVEYFDERTPFKSCLIAADTL